MLAHIGTTFGASGCLVVLLLLTAVRLRRALALRRRPAVYRRRARKLQERTAALFLFPSASAITTTRHLRMLTCPCALTHASGHAQRTLRPTASATGDGRARRCARAQPGGAHRLQELCIRPAVSNACLMHQLRRKCDWRREPLLPACMAVRSASSVHVCSIEPHPVTRDLSPSGSIAVVFLLDASARLGKAS